MKIILFARILGSTRLYKISRESGLLSNFGSLIKIRNAHFGHCGPLGVKSLHSQQEFGHVEMETQSLVKRLNFYSIKYSKFDKRTFIIHFNEHLPSPLKRSLGNSLLTWVA